MSEKMKVFIVEDDRFLLDMYVIKFGERGFDVMTAFGGDDALSKIEKDKIKPDVMLLDLVMPGLGGFELLEKIKKENYISNTVIIILSNLGQKEDIDRGITLGANGYIVKASATPSEVVNKVIAIMEKSGKQ